MKKFLFVSMMVFVAFIMACASQQMASSGSDGQPAKERRAVRGTTSATPCFVPDAGKDFFACTGIIETTESMEGDAYNLALQLAQDMCARKLEHTVKGLAKSYQNRYGSNKGNDLASKMEAGLNHVIKEKMKETSQSCQLADDYINESTGRFRVYVGIQIPRKDVSDVAKKEIHSQAEKNRTSYEAHEFDKEVEKAMAEAATEDEEKQQKYIEEHTKVLE